ncbi:MAG: ScyD/ScyE family protein [Ignavibacteriaceae bacterium]|nr:ScyD/ScyE family protein [Ignavibacteriaceae bacterium]
MRITKIFYLLLFIAAALIIYSCSNKEQIPVAASVDKSAIALKVNSNPNVTVFATGLNAPRGLKFGPDGYLYVAEGGLGGSISTAGLCDSVIPPIGPYLGGHTARVVKLDSHGVLTVVADQLPSSQDARGDHMGAADVAFIGNTLYALLGGAGCSHGVESTPNSIIKINPDGTWNVVADLSYYQKTHPVAHPNADDFEPDGTWYSMVNVRGDLYAVEPNHCEMVKVTTNGDIKRVIDFSAIYGHIVPTSVAYHGNFFVGNLDTFPTVAGGSNIYKVTPSGQSMIWARGFSEVLGLVIDQNDRMYVLESSAVTGGPAPSTGRIVKVEPSGKREVIADSLFFPTGITMGPDGALYVSNKGFGPPIPGFGEILRIQIGKENHDNDDDHNGKGHGDTGGHRK